MSGASTVEMIARIGGGLLVVMALVFISARVAKRVRGHTGNSGLRVVDRVVLSRDAHLAVVEAGGRRLLLGVTPQRISLVGALDEDEILDDATDDAGLGAALGAVSLGSAEPAPDAPIAEPPPGRVFPDQSTELAAGTSFDDVLAQVSQPAARRGAHSGSADHRRGYGTAAQVYAAPGEAAVNSAADSGAGYVPASVSALDEEEPLPMRRRRQARHAGAPANDAPEPAQTPAAASVPAPVPASVPARTSAASSAPSPAPAPGPATAPMRLKPSGLDLSGHPDLASALRAAGRTTTSGQAQPAPASSSVPRNAVPPRGAASASASARAEAAEAAEAAAAQALIQASQAGAAAAAAPARSAQSPDQAAAEQAKRVPRQRRQASGSVLSPATWKQGIEALRELTVRRG